LKKKKVVEKEKELFGEDEYGGAELEGMRVGHKLEALMGDQDSDQVILTFRDTSVLKGNDLNEDEMVLENVEMAEKQKFDRYYEKKRKSKYDELDEKKEILSKYDDEENEQNEGFVLTKGGQVDLTDAQRKLEIKKIGLNGKLFIGKRKQFQNWKFRHRKKKVADEYLTKEETEAKFKTKKKKPTKKSTKKKSIETSETDSNEIDSAQDSLKNLLNKKLNEENEIEGNDRKSRNAINQRDLIDIQQEQKRLNKYQRAIEKANEQSKVIYQKNENMDVETKNEDSAPIASRKKPEKKSWFRSSIIERSQKTKRDIHHLRNAKWGRI